MLSTYVPGQLAELVPVQARPELAMCAECGDITAPNGKCLNVGDCRGADRSATRQSLARGTAASARTSPAAWNISGRVD